MNLEKFASCVTPWISVNERLPSKADCDECENKFIVTFKDVNLGDYILSSWVDAFSLEKEKFFIEIHLKIYEAVFWMPFPKIPNFSEKVLFQFPIPV